LQKVVGVTFSPQEIRKEDSCYHAIGTWRGRVR
jgi:hypothetical protein